MAKRVFFLNAPSGTINNSQRAALAVGLSPFAVSTETEEGTFMTGSAFYAYCLRIIKRTDKSTEVYEAMTDTVRDMRMRFLSEDFKTVSSALTITSIGNYSTSLPSDFGHIMGDVMMFDGSSDEEYEPLRKISIERYNDLYSSRYNSAVGNKLTGSPRHFCIFDGNLLVGPPVDKTSYTFRVTHTTEDGVEIDSTTTDVPFTNKYRHIVRYGVLKNTYLMLENYEEANVWSALYETDLQKLVDNDKLNTRDNLPIKFNGV